MSQTCVIVSNEFHLMILRRDERERAFVGRDKIHQSLGAGDSVVGQGVKMSV
jgi:hypothetical protein